MKYCLRNSIFEMNISQNEDAFSSPQLIVIYVFFSLSTAVFFCFIGYSIKAGGYAGLLDSFQYVGYFFIFPLVFYFCFAAVPYLFAVLDENNFEKGCLNFTLAHFLATFTLPFCIIFGRVTFDLLHGKKIWKSRYNDILESESSNLNYFSFIKALFGGLFLCLIGSFLLFFSRNFLSNCDEKTEEIELNIYILSFILSYLLLNYTFYLRKYVSTFNEDNCDEFNLFLIMSFNSFLINFTSLVSFVLSKTDIFTLETHYSISLFLFPVNATIFTVILIYIIMNSKYVQKQSHLWSKLSNYKRKNKNNTFEWKSMEKNEKIYIYEEIYANK